MKKVAQRMRWLGRSRRILPKMFGKGPKGSADLSMETVNLSTPEDSLMETLEGEPQQCPMKSPERLQATENTRPKHRV